MRTLSLHSLAGCSHGSLVLLERDDRSSAHLALRGGACPTEFLRLISSGGGTVMIVMLVLVLAVVVAVAGM